MRRSALFVHASSDLYGSDLACLHAAVGAVEAGWQVTVTVPWDGPLVAHLRDAGAEVIELDPLKLRRAEVAWPAVLVTPLRWLRNFRRLRRLARTRRFDLVYTTTAPTTGGALLARRWRVPHVYHVHEIFWQARPLVRGLDRLLQRADVVLCCSRAVAEQFSARVHTRVAYTGGQVDPATPTRRPLTGGTVTIVCVARLNEWKGQDVLIDAIATLARDGVSARLRLVGDVYRGELVHRRLLEQQVERLGLAEQVTFEGERRDAHSIVGAADLVVLPSKRAEPFGMVLVEAMLLGRPVIATDAGGPAEIITTGEHGLLVPPGDAAALARAIAWAIDHPELASAMAERGRGRAAAFTTAAMVDAVLDAFAEVVGDDVRPTP